MRPTMIFYTVVFAILAAIAASGCDTNPCPDGAHIADGLYHYTYTDVTPPSSQASGADTIPSCGIVNEAPPRACDWQTGMGVCTEVVSAGCVVDGVAVTTEGTLHYDAQANVTGELVYTESTYAGGPLICRSVYRVKAELIAKEVE